MDYEQMVKLTDMETECGRHGGKVELRVLEKAS